MLYSLISLYASIWWVDLHGNYSGKTGLFSRGQFPLAQLLHIKHWYIKIDVYISIAVKVCLNNGLFQGGGSC